jgi:hypothetical protein
MTKSNTERSEALGMNSPIAEKVSRLWTDVNRHNLAEYMDDEWCEEWDSDRYILEVLSWNHHSDSSRQSERDRVFAEYSRIGKPLHQLTTTEVRNLGNGYPVPWQRAHLTRLVGFLQSNDLSFDQLCTLLREAGPGLSLAILEDAFQTTNTKIPACFLRDHLRYDLFPIDRRVEEVLDSYGIPPDSWLLSEVCRRLALPTRVFARATWSLASSLVEEKSRKPH